jgi:hypothetical protein
MYETEFLMFSEEHGLLLVPEKKVLRGTFGFREKLYDRTWGRK